MAQLWATVGEFWPQYLPVNVSRFRASERIHETEQVLPDASIICPVQPVGESVTIGRRASKKITSLS